MRYNTPMSLSVSPVSSREQWDAFLKQYSPGALFQSWMWGEVAGGLGSPVERLGLWEGSTLVGILQIQKVAARRGAFLHVRHGPVLVEPGEKYWRETMELLRKKAKESHVLFVRISPHVPDTEELRGLFASMGLSPAAIHAMDAEYCWILDITQPEDELLKGMRKTTRYEIKRAGTVGVTVNVSDDQNTLGSFLGLYEKTFQRHGFVPHEGIAEEFAAFSKEKQAIMLTGSYLGEITAAAIVLFHNGEAIYHHGASIPAKAPVTYAVQWRAILEAKKRGMKQYNFWGIAPADKPDHPWQGITLFKTGFGGKAVQYLHAHDMPVSPLYALPRTIETIRRMRKGY